MCQKMKGNLVGENGGEGICREIELKMEESVNELGTWSKDVYMQGLMFLKCIIYLHNLKTSTEGVIGKYIEHKSLFETPNMHENGQKRMRK